MEREVVLGTMNFSRLVGHDEALRILRQAYRSGIRAINTADSDYSGASEEFVGEFLSEIPPAERPWLMVELSGKDMGVPRNPNLSPQYLRAACERSLRRLGVDSVDRVVIPRPSFQIALEETLNGVNELIIRPGLATSYGVSTFPSWLSCHGMHLCQSLGLPPIASELAPLNVLDRRAEIELLPNARFWGIEFFAWAAIGQGLLAGRYPAGPLPAESRAARLGGIYAARVAGNARSAASLWLDLCAQYGYEPAAAAIRWVLDIDGVSGALVGPRQPDHIRPMSEAKAITLGVDFRDAVDRVAPPGSASADFFNSAPWMCGFQHELVQDGEKE